MGKGGLFHSVIQGVDGEGAQPYPVRHGSECNIQGSAERTGGLSLDTGQQLSMSKAVLVPAVSPLSL